MESAGPALSANLEAATAGLAPGQAHVFLHRLRASGWLLTVECRPELGSGALRQLAKQALKSDPSPRPTAPPAWGTPCTEDGTKSEVTLVPDENTPMGPSGQTTATPWATRRRHVLGRKLLGDLRSVWVLG